MSTTTAPVATPAPPAAPLAAEVSDPVCHQLAADSEPDSGGDASQASTDDAPAGSDDGNGEPRRKKRERITACSVARPNISREAAAILAAQSHARPLPRAPWNHKAAPARLELIRRRFELAPDELAQLTRTGALVPARLDQPGYAYAYHEIFQSQLPVYITADSLFHAIFASHDAIVEKLETASLAPALAGAFDQMHCALSAAAADYPTGTARDLDLYLTVARSLLGVTPVRSILGDPSVDAEAEGLVAKVHAAAGAETLALFGRPRIIDFTAYTPRGHYTRSEDLTRYFVAAMWASRIELNLVSRSSRSSAPGPEPDPSETPREAIDALALADLAGRSGAAASIGVVDQAWTLLAGRREDVAIDQLAQLRKAAGIASLRDASAFPALKRAIGDGFQRTTRLHPMPEGTRVLPAIATLIGPRVVPDAHALMPVVNSAVPGRNTAHTADVVYSLGLDRGKHYLARDLAAFPALGEKLEVARTIARTTRLGDDLYSAWYAAIRALATVPTGALPSFATTDVGADLRFNTMAAAYGQLKHNYVLMAGQPYSEFGCEIPDGYVEPAPAAYDALIEYASRGGKVAALLDPQDHTRAKAHFARVADTLRVIRKIVDDELANRPLTTQEKRWLGMVSELSVDTSQDITGYPPVYSGWYFDLFLDAEGDGMRGASYIADYFTSVEDGISYAGATAPRMGIFVVDAGGAPRAFVGPVARAFETHTPLATRLTDDSPLPSIEDPWAASYTIADPGTRPQLALRYDRETGDVIVASAGALGPATIKLLDHHRVPLATRTHAITSGETVFAFHKKSKVGAVYVSIGAFRDWVVGDSYGEIHDQWGKRPDSDE
ncbi:MAG TPA: DUF3160 domain-containing protein [Kofleriaceae bacterium]